jgi:DNA-binding NtrC family response regulator
MPIKSNTTKKILICEDEENVRESLKLILGDYYDLILTDSTEQCLECLRNSKDINVLLLNIKMAEVNELKLLANIQKQHPTIPVVIITDYNFVETASSASKLGTKDYIGKPFKSEEILKMVGKFLA